MWTTPGSGYVRNQNLATPLAGILWFIVQERSASQSPTADGAWSATPRIDDPALLELVVSRAARGPERSRALHLLGWTPCSPVTLIAALGPVHSVGVLADTVKGARSPLRRAVIGRVHALAIAGPFPTVALPPDIRLGVGATGYAIEAADSFEQAVRAVRFATTVAEAGVLARQLVHSADLGPFDLLAAKLPSADIHGVADLDQFELLAASPDGRGVLQALEAIAQAGSLREAARRLHLHHNSIAARVRKAEDRLGYRITEPAGSARLQLGLALRRLRETDLLA